MGNERTSAIHHAAGVTNVIPDILVIAELRLRRNTYVRERTQGHGETLIALRVCYEIRTDTGNSQCGKGRAV